MQFTFQQKHMHEKIHGHVQDAIQTGHWRTERKRMRAAHARPDPLAPVGPDAPCLAGRQRGAGEGPACLLRRAGRADSTLGHGVWTPGAAGCGPATAHGPGFTPGSPTASAAPGGTEHVSRDVRLHL